MRLVGRQITTVKTGKPVPLEIEARCQVLTRNPSGTAIGFESWPARTQTRYL